MAPFFEGQMERIPYLPYPLHSLAAKGDFAKFKHNFMKNTLDLFDPSEVLRESHVAGQPEPMTYSLDTANKHGMTCLHAASYYGHLDIALFLVCQGADVNLFSTFGYSIHTSSNSNETGTTAKRGRNWATALHFAAVNGHRNVAVLLLDRGADPSMLDYKGYTAAQLAMMNGHRKTAAIIDYYAGRLPKTTTARREVLAKIEGCKKAIEDLRVLSAILPHKLSYSPSKSFSEGVRQARRRSSFRRESLFASNPDIRHPTLGFDIDLDADVETLAAASTDQPAVPGLEVQQVDAVSIEGDELLRRPDEASDDLSHDLSHQQSQEELTTESSAESLAESENTQSEG